MIVVTWGDDGNLAVIDDQGRVIDSSSTAAQHEVEDRLASPVTVWLPGEYQITYTPGQPEHRVAALEAMEGAILTQSPDAV